MDFVDIFPPDVWDVITRHIDCFTVFALAFTSKNMFSVLAHGGLTCFSLSGESDGSVEVFPIASFLASMTSLRHLDLKSTYSDIVPITALPPSLLSLRLDGRQERPPTFYVNLPPTLTHLDLFLPLREDAILPCLPPWLISLVIEFRVPPFFHIQSSPVIISLPPQLVSLTMTFALKAEIIPLLPPTLTRLHCYLIDNINQVLPLIPSTILDLSIKERLDERQVRMLPQRLQVLRCKLDFHLSSLTALPRSLTQFRDSKSDAMTMNSTLFVLLNRPDSEHTRYLEHLSTMLEEQYWDKKDSYFESDDYYWTTDGVIKLLQSTDTPKGTNKLRELSFPKILLDPQRSTYPPPPSSPPRHFDISTFKSLNYLTKLQIWESEVSLELLNELPDSITWLHVLNELSNDWRLPASLETLICKLGSSTQARALQIAPCVRWPPNFTTLISLSHLASTYDSYIPSTLTSLKCRSLLSESSEQINMKLFQHLKSLECPDIPNLTDQHILALPKDAHTLIIDHCPKVSVGILPQLPPCLTKLSLGWCLSSFFLDENLPLLPQTLTYLNLGHSLYISYSGIATLPRGLMTLYWDYCYELSVAVAQALPPALTDLSLKFTTQVAGNAIRLLPRHLKRLILTNMLHLDHIYFYDFPSSLTYLDISSMKNVRGRAIEILCGFPFISLCLHPDMAFNQQERLWLSKVHYSHARHTKCIKHGYSAIVEV